MIMRYSTRAACALPPFGGAADSRCAMQPQESPRVEGGSVEDGGSGSKGDKGASGVLQCDRSLLTFLRMLDEESGEPLVSRPAPVVVVNAHLTAGPNAPRRLRQVHEATETIRKLKAKAAESIAKSDTAMVIAGDFNSQARRRCGSF